MCWVPSTRYSWQVPIQTRETQPAPHGYVYNPCPRACSGVWPCQPPPDRSWPGRRRGSLSQPVPCASPGGRQALWVSELLPESGGGWCWWLSREHSRLPWQGCGEKQQPQASLISLTIVLSNCPLGETSLCFLLSIFSSFLLSSFYSCPLHHIPSMPQKASELHANQDTEFALSWVKAVDAIQVPFLLR